MLYSINSIFETLQGEGGRAGTRAIFVRFSGCNMWGGHEDGRTSGKGACALWCDTNFLPKEKLNASQIAERAVELWGSGVEERWVVFSGGEPLLQLDDELIYEMRERGFKIAIETNGTRALPMTPAFSMIDWVCVSPKKNFDGSLNFVQRGGHELKVVLPGGTNPWTDMELLQLQCDTAFNMRSVQAQDGPGREEALARCLDFVRRNPAWRLSVQMHKILGLP